MFSKPETEHFLHQSIVYKQDFAGKCLQVFLKEKIFSSDQQKKRCWSGSLRATMLEQHGIITATS